MGRDIADALSHMSGQCILSDGLCQHVGEYTVIGAQGHLFCLAAPEAYGQDFDFPWRLEPLPVLPATFRLEPNFQKEKGRVVNSSLTQSIRARLAKIKDLMAQARAVVHAGDPDREGQLIVDDLLRQFNFKGPVRRLWLHAQTLEGIQQAWRKMVDNTQYASLGLAAVARRESDWVIGMNATRAYSALWWKKGHKGILNIGRVVTPLVGMVVQREKDKRAAHSIAFEEISLSSSQGVDGDDDGLLDRLTSASMEENQGEQNERRIDLENAKRRFAEKLNLVGWPDDITRDRVRLGRPPKASQPMTAP